MGIAHAVTEGMATCQSERLVKWLDTNSAVYQSSNIFDMALYSL